MKLLFDQNLSPALVRLLDSAYPGSAHTEPLGLGEADDAVLYEYAKAHGFVIATKDAGFVQRSAVCGHPPKVILIRLGNCPTREVAALLHGYRRTIDDFVTSEDAALLYLPFPVARS